MPSFSQPRPAFGARSMVTKPAFLLPLELLGRHFTASTRRQPSLRAPGSTNKSNRTSAQCRRRSPRPHSLAKHGLVDHHDLHHHQHRPPPQLRISHRRIPSGRPLIIYFHLNTSNRHKKLCAAVGSLQLSPPPPCPRSSGASRMSQRATRR